MHSQQINIHDTHLGLIKTYMGKRLDLNNPTAEMIDPIDIAHALSQICRFGGHTLDFYSVAEHCILVAALAPKELKLEALMHDAAEAYIGDVIKPLKNILGETYARIERSFMTAITERFNLSTDKLDDIKPYDMQALELENDAFRLGNRYAKIELREKTLREYGNKFVWSNTELSFCTLMRRYKASILD